MEVDTKAESLRMTGAAALVTIYGMTLSEWAAVATIVYLAVQIIVLSPKAFEVVAGWGAWLAGRWKTWRS